MSNPEGWNILERNYSDGEVIFSDGSWIVEIHCASVDYDPLTGDVCSYRKYISTYPLIAWYKVEVEHDAFDKGKQTILQPMIWMSPEKNHVATAERHAIEFSNRRQQVLFIEVRPKDDPSEPYDN